MDADRACAWAVGLKAFAHPTRLQILVELRKGTRCVTDMEPIDRDKFRDDEEKAATRG